MIESSRSLIRVQILFLLFFLFLLIPARFYFTPGAGIDSSWNIAIHLAHKYRLVFGRGFAFTYGPLGILHSRLPIAISGGVYLLFDLYLLASMFFVLRAAFNTGFGVGTILFILLDIYLSRDSLTEDLYFFLFLFYLFTFLRKSDSRFYLLQTALLSLIGFYLKVSTGLPEIALFLVTLVYATLREKLDWRRAGIVLAVYVLVLWLSSMMLRVSIGLYIKSGMELIDNFNDAMYMPLSPPYIPLAYAAVGLLAMLTIWVLYRLGYTLVKKRWASHLDELFIYALICLAVFILFKHAFLRGDTHVNFFFHGIGLYIALVYLFGPEKEGKRITATICWITLLVVFWGAQVIYTDTYSYKKFLTFGFVGERAAGVVNYVKGIRNYGRARAKSDSLDQCPNPLKDRLGNHTVDVIPSEISEIYFNGLHYAPRPVVQSYSAYSHYLDSLNSAAYLGPNAPDYILFSLSAIDGRYPLFDEPMTKLAVLSRYTLDGEFNGELILRKKPGSFSIPVPAFDEPFRVSFGDTIQLPHRDDLQYIRIDVRYNFWGKLQRLFYKPPPLDLTIMTKNGITRTFRAVKPIVEEGVPMNKFVENTDDFELWMASAGKRSADISAIRVGTRSAHSGFEDKVLIHRWHYPFPASPVDSTTLTGILEKYRPRTIDATRLQDAPLHEGIQEFRDEYPYFRLTGWAYKENDGGGQRTVILKGQNKSYAIPTRAVLMPWTGIDPHKKGFDSLGFEANVSKDLLEPGDYRVGLAIQKPGNERGSVYYFNDLHVFGVGHYRVDPIDIRLTKPYKDTAIACWGDSVHEVDNNYILSGFAFLKNTDTKKTKLTLLLVGNNKAYKINTDRTRRADLTTSYKSSFYEYGGYFAELPKDSLPPGDYVELMEIEDDHGRVQGIRYSNIHFVVGQ
jgi:hypothetical protein